MLVKELHWKSCLAADLGQTLIKTDMSLGLLELIVIIFTVDIPVVYCV